MDEVCEGADDELELVDRARLAEVGAVPVLVFDPLLLAIVLSSPHNPHSPKKLKIIIRTGFAEGLLLTGVVAACVFDGG